MWRFDTAKKIQSRVHSFPILKIHLLNPSLYYYSVGFKVVAFSLSLSLSLSLSTHTDTHTHKQSKQTKRTILINLN